MTKIFTLLLVVTGFAFAANSQPAGDNGLKITLSADKAVYHSGQIVRFTVTFYNTDSQEFRIFEPSSFQGEEFVIEDISGNTLHWSGGLNTYSPKIFLFPGQTHLVRPGGEKTIALSAFFAKDRRLLFGEGNASRGTYYSAGVGRVLGDIPKEYICSGRIFSLVKPGVYKVLFKYEKSEHDKGWRVSGNGDSSTENIWMGSVESNSVKIEFD